ncbi:MAG TPA: DUF58 domain-containing protein [Actinomycetota bacterium]|nr:DUF58 domain-containing protein [Actinomycetota bacterium]
MRLRRRAVGLALGAVILFVIGTNAQAGWLFVLAALLLGALVAGIIVPLVAVRGLAVELVAPVETRQGADTPVHVTVVNPGRAVRWGIVARDEHIGGASTYVGTIRPGERVEARTERGAPRRGAAHTSWVELRSAAPFGVAERRRRLPADATTLVLPRVVPLGPLPFVDLATSREAATDSDARRGQGPEYLGVREFRPGDPIRQIHWRLTARHGELVVRDLEEHRVARLAIWIDTHADGEALDDACSAAASIVSSASTNGVGVRLAAATPDGPALVSRASALVLHRWLARLGPAEISTQTAIGWLAGDPVRGVGTLVAISRAESWDPDARASLDALARVVPRVVLVTTGGEPRADVAGGFEVAPWLGEDGFGSSFAATAARVGAPV